MTRSNARTPLILLALLAALGSGSAHAQDPTVIYLVRHAETEFPPYADNPPNPFLNEVGMARANTLAEELGEIGLDHVFSTEYRRTWTTALPVAQRVGLEVEAYDPRDLAAFADQLRQMSGTLLVVGHSNTTPMLVEALGGEPGEPIDERQEFNRIYRLTIAGDSVETQAEHYGAPLPERLRAEGATTRDAALVAATPQFNFYSSFWSNLHDFMYWQGLENSSAPDPRECLATLPSEYQEAWSFVAEAYRNNMADRNPRTDPLMRAIRFEFAGLAQEPPTGNAAEFIGALRRAAPAYQVCLWAEHDARNRAWVGELVPLLDAHQEEMVERLNVAYADEFPAELPVDIMSYASGAGANTTGRPLHMALSALDPDNLAPGSFEIAFHEGSHGVFGAGWGTTYDVLESAFSPRGIEARRDIWHSVLFFTSGRLARDILRRNGYPEYESYMVRVGVYDELYPMLMETWQPYLDGEIDMQTAAERFAQAVADELAQRQ